MGNNTRAPATQGKRFSIEIETFKPYRSGTLFGLTDIVIPEMQLKIRELTVHESHGKRWVGLPGRPMIDCGGKTLLDERDKPKYTPVLQFLGRRFGDAFSHAVIAALLEHAPNAFEREPVV